jgi:ATP-dependent DNA helicase RecG
MFQIPAAPPGIPTTWRSRCYGREGESIDILSVQEIEEICGQTKEDWSAGICEKATINDLDPEAIHKARLEYKNRYPDISSEIESWDEPTFLNKAKLTIQNRITRTAIILLGKDESEHFLSPSVAKISWILKDEKDNKVSYQHFGSPLILKVDQVLSKIRNLQYRYLPDETLFPIDVTKYDPWVIREALHNCIAHQDYELQGGICLTETPDELIFENVGSFIPGTIEIVIRPNYAPHIYRNRFLSTAMVNLNMIDIIGSGIKRMFETQMKRCFPLPDYDLSKPDTVSVRIQGRILNETYARLLIKNPIIDLQIVILLDRVQKNIRISKDERKILKSKKLVEGRYPNIFLSSKIATTTDEKARYIKYRAFDDQHYKDMIIAYIKKYGAADRKDIDKLLMDKLSGALDESRKRKKISNILYAMSKKDKTIKNSGTYRQPKWILSQTN